jgi:hypothetical protein
VHRKVQARFGGGQKEKEQQCHLVGWLPYNIIRKVAPDAFGQRVVENGKGVLISLVVHPVRIVVPRTKLKNKRSVAKASGQ